MIRAGLYNGLCPETRSLLGNISSEAADYVRVSLKVNPSERLSVQQLLDHPFIVKWCVEKRDGMKGVLQGLLQFSHLPKFRRRCMQLVALSFSNEDQAKVRDCFTSLDTKKQGVVTKDDLKHAMLDHGIAQETEVLQVFQAFGEEIHYSDFLATMLETQMDPNEELLQSVFRRFNQDLPGYIAADDLHQVLGDELCGKNVVKEADCKDDESINFAGVGNYKSGTAWTDDVDPYRPGSLTLELREPLDVPELEADTASLKMVRFEEFLEQVDPYFKGRGKFVADALGSYDLDEILDNASERIDLVDLDKELMKEKNCHTHEGELKVNKLFAALMKEKSQKVS